MAHDLVVVVPGFLGSVLERRGREIWNTTMAAAWTSVTSTTDLLNSLRLPEGLGDEPADGAYAADATRLVTGWHVLPGLWAGAGYHRLLARLQRLDRPERVLTFPYDWRLSVPYNARELGRRIELTLERWRSQPGEQDARVVFIGHSMGGLIAAAYVAAYGGAEVTRRIITVGTPFAGAVRTVKAYAGGLTPAAERLDTALTRLTRTLPAVANLLPSYRFATHSGVPADLREVTLPGVPRTAAEAAFAVPDLLLKGDLTDAVHLGGRRQPTELSAEVAGDGIAYRRRLADGTDFPAHGDGIVPAFACLPAHPAVGTRTMHFAVRHATLQNDDHVLEHTVDAVDGSGVDLPSGPELTAYLPEVIRAGEPARVWISSDNATLPLTLRITHVDGRVLEPALPLRPLGDGNQGAILRLPAGAWEVRATTVTGPPATVADIVIAIS
ncbi:esterase/lipase family protein [Hamadaea tsunoensis]|uniref:esterase/lipase family protein n=1 Tax=Hamadaea tsunoensis TaxID=53368 RepID=UPI0004229792|nr:hypothetical protein [Hamadaea tsunoensis]